MVLDLHPELFLDRFYTVLSTLTGLKKKRINCLEIRLGELTSHAPLVVHMAPGAPSGTPRARGLGASLQQLVRPIAHLPEG